MPNHIDLNKILADIPARATAKTGDLVALAGQELKIESAPDGQEINLGIVPPGKKWITSYVVHVEEVDA
jgi:hypothetical protein